MEITDADRYNWLKRNVKERLTDNSLKNEYSEHKTQYVFPVLIAFADFCGNIPLDEAIDIEINRENDES